MNRDAADWQAFARLLERTLGRGFRLVVVEASSPVERAELLGWLAERTAGRTMAEVGSGGAFAVNPLDALRALPQADVIVVSGFEDSEREGSPYGAALQALNVQRDVLVAEFPVFWVLVLHPSLRAQAAQVAPDFLDFASLWVAADAPEVSSLSTAPTPSPCARSEVPIIWSPVPWVGSPTQRALLDAAWEAMGQGRRDPARDLAARVRLAGGELANEQAALIEGFVELGREPGAWVAERLEGIGGLTPPLLAVAAVGAAHAWNAAGEPAQVEAVLAKAAGADARWGLTALWIQSLHLRQRGELSAAFVLIRDRVLPGWHALASDREVAVAWGGLAAIAQVRGEWDEALRIRREEELPVYERLGDVRSRAIAQGGIANILCSRGQPDEALRIFREEVLLVFERLGEVRERAVTLGRIADILQSRGQLDEALRIRREEQLPVFERLGEVRERAFTLGRIADILQSRGQLDEALRIHREETLPVFERLGDVRSRAVTLGQIANILGSRGQFDEALRIFREEVIPVFERLGDVHSQAVTLGRIADILQSRGQLDEALRIHREEELPVYERLGDERARAVSLGNIADILQSRGQLGEALRIRRDEQLPVFERYGDVRERAVTVSKIADILQSRGQPEKALSMWEKQVLPPLHKLGARREIAMAEQRVGSLLLQRGKGSDRRRARQHLERAHAALTEMGLPEAADVAKAFERAFGRRL